MRAFICVALTFPFLSTAPAAAAMGPLVHYQLDNGLRVALLPDTRFPEVAVRVTYDVGWLEGGQELTHVTEHLLFEPSGHSRADPGSVYTSVGARGVNANTDTFTTQFFATVPANGLETALWLESDRMGFPLRRFNEKTLQKTRRIVARENEQRIEDSAYGFAFTELNHEIFTGTRRNQQVEQALMSISTDDVIEHLETWFVPSNATLVLVGDFDVRQTRLWISEYFSPLPTVPKPTRTVAGPSVRERPLRLVTRNRLTQVPLVASTWITPTSIDEGIIDILARLVRHSLEMEPGLANASSSIRMGRGYSALNVLVEQRASETAESLEERLGLLIYTISKSVSEDECERAKRAAIVNNHAHLDRPASAAGWLSHVLARGEDANLLLAHVERINALTVEDVRAAAESFWRGSQWILHVAPEKK